MRFKLFGTQIYVSFLFAAIIAFMIATDRTGLVLPTLFAIMIHEGGHLFAMWLCECQPKSVRLIPASVQIVRKMAPRDKGELVVSVFGPLINLFMFAVLFLNYRLFHNQTTLTVALLNLILCLFNLLPVKGLDGGAILKELLCGRVSEQKINIILNAISLVLAAATLFAGIVLAYRGSLNLSVFIVAIYIAIGTFIKQ